MKKINSILRKCKSLSRQLGRSSSYSSLRSKSMTQYFRPEEHDYHLDNSAAGANAIIYVGSTRKRYVISSKFLSHPVLNALIERSAAAEDGGGAIAVRCEVVLFDHLMWMLENSDTNIGSVEELAELYVF